MEPSRYKQVKTKRGFTYSYFSAPAKAGKPVLLFAHGFPSEASVWHKQVAFFEPLGFGLIVPDLLGYGGTDKPTDPKLYVGSGHAHDIADILDAAGVQQVIAIGHDWGSAAVSRLINYYPQRVAACAFLAVGYNPPAAHNADLASRSHEIAKLIGYDAFAYMRFFIQPDAAAVIEEHMDSFISLIFPESPQLWKDHLCVDGGTRAWIEGEKTAGLPPYMTIEDKETIKKSLLSGGLAGPLCWYKIQVEKISGEDNANISPAAADVLQPLLFIAFTKDNVALPAFGDRSHNTYAKGPVTRKEVDGDHWAVESHPAEISNILLQWVEAL
ncbi:alpha/beta-hydrolase [Mycena filopes]|nr:alpha/beta-hydrolase [Mycena filopes]